MQEHFKQFLTINFCYLEDTIRFFYQCMMFNSAKISYTCSYIIMYTCHMWYYYKYIIIFKSSRPFFHSHNYLLTSQPSHN